MNGRVLAMFLLALATMVWSGAICGDPGQPSPGSTKTSTDAATPLPTPTASPGEVAAAVQAATSFGDFPIVWLGDSYDSNGDGVGDMPLVAAYYLSGEAVVNPRTGAVIFPAVRSFTLVYGTCEIPKEQNQCGNPITIRIEPAADQFLPLGGVEGRVAVRGIDAETYSGGALSMATADMTVKILPAFATDGDEKLSQSLRIANQLRGANPKASQITLTSDFRQAETTPVSAVP